MEVVRVVEGTSTDSRDKPAKEVKIVRSGVLTDQEDSASSTDSQ